MQLLSTPRKTANRASASAARLIASGTLAMGAGLFAAKAFSFLRDLIIASVFGATSHTDALLVAMQAPLLLDSLLASTAVYSALMPPICDLLEQGENRAVARLVGNASTLILLVSGTASIVLAIGAPLVVKLLAGGFPPEVQGLTAQLVAITILAAPLMGLSNVAWSALNALDRFLLPSLSLSLGAIAVIVTTLFLGREYGVYAPAAGVLIGMVLQVVVQYVGLGRLGITYSPFINLHDPNMRRALRLFLPLWMGGVLVALSPYVDNLLASYLSTGSISALRYGYTLTVPIMTGVVAVSLAAFPRLTTMVAKADYARLVDTLRSTSRSLVIVLIGVSAWIILMRYSIVSVVFQRGMFDADAVWRTSWALGAYAVGLPFSGLYYYLIRGMFALSKTRTFLAISAVSLIANVILDLVLMRWLGFVGIALSSACVQIATAVLGSAALSSHLHASGFLWGIWRPILVCTLAAAIGYTGGILMSAWVSSLGADRWLQLLSLQFTFVALYLALTWVLELRGCCGIHPAQQR